MTRTKRLDWSICLGLVGVALLVRLIGQDYGYFHGDERVNDAARVLTGQLVPGQHFYPPLIHYLNGLAFVFLFPVGLIAGWWDGAAGFRAAYFTDPQAFYMAARTMSALWGALLAPVFYLVARQMRLLPRFAVVMGLFGAVFPLSVFMSHIAKGDAALASVSVACFGAMLARLNGCAPRRWDWILGGLVALCLSFKHSAIFVLLPLGLAWVGLLLTQEGARAALRSVGRVMLAILLLWPILNIGLLLDIKGFLAFQQIQSVMSLRSGGLSAGLPVLGTRSLETSFGVGAPVVIASLLAPLLILKAPDLSQRAALLMIWGALSAATVVTAALTGDRQPEHLWIANFAGFVMISLLVGLTYVQNGRTFYRYTAVCWLSLAALLSCIGTGRVLLQAVAEPNQLALEQYLADTHAQRRILTAVPLSLRQHPKAYEAEQTRITWLAKKYNAQVPEAAPDRLAPPLQANSVYYRALPQVMFGLEAVTEGQETYEVRAHTWPLQAAEWQRSHWAAEGIDLFVIRDFEQNAYVAPPKIRQDFFRSLDADCDLLRQFEAKKTLFLERELRVYDCQS